MSDKKTIIVTQKKSPIGRQAYQRQTLIGLGFTIIMSLLIKHLIIFCKFKKS